MVSVHSTRETCAEPNHSRQNLIIEGSGKATPHVVEDQERLHGGGALRGGP